MKKAAAYIFLLSYVVMFCKPVTPIISDTIAHALYYYQHMATVHYENGKMHVHKEMIQKAGKENSSNDQAIIKKHQSTEEYISSENSCPVFPASTQKSFYTFLPEFISKLSPGNITPPPRLI